MTFPDVNNCTIAIIGLGYVGLPLSVEFGKTQKCLITGSKISRKVIGFDINQKRLSDLELGQDSTNEVTKKELLNSSQLQFTSNQDILSRSDVFIVTVPTPIDSAKNPDLKSIKSACKLIGKSIKNRSYQIKTSPLIIFESTVYPGATEELCAPLIEQESGLEFNKEFYCGFSPERINPGDSEHRLSSIVKVTSGSTKDSADWIDRLYQSIIKAGTYRASSIKVAEAAKVIENTQRDLNIALINELAIIFKKMNIDTLEVLEAACTKWNFLNFKPGLVGGHCIGVDPYYLTFKSEQLGYKPEVVLAGRKINDSMGDWIVEQLIREMALKRIIIGGAKVLIMGLTFKENCPDIRNTKVVDIIKKLSSYDIDVTIVDPLAKASEAKNEYELTLLSEVPYGKTYSAVIIAVAHNNFLIKEIKYWEDLLNENGILFDLKGILPRELNALRL